jgi:2-(1,2-epoxy-1,2-dihydrophenyl)acetyl-CoA isomerase
MNATPELAMNAAEAVGRDLLVTKQDGRLNVVFNRPDVANALTTAQCLEIVDLLHQASTDPMVRVVTLAANGRHFCAGMDLRSAREPDALPPGGPDRYPGRTMTIISSESQRLISAVLDCMKPVVAIVQGPAAGLGLYLALASDIVVAARDAIFVEAFLARGMVLHCGGAHLLVSRLGMQRAKELSFFGGRLDAQAAYQLGLVNRVAEPGDLQTVADEMVDRLAAAPTIAIGLSKRLLNRAVGAERGTAFSEEAMAMEINGGTHDSAEGALAFGQRRQPVFAGW